VFDLRKFLTFVENDPRDVFLLRPSTLKLVDCIGLLWKAE
jgi:hypothetical protein